MSAVAFLPMYDTPGIRPAYDALWAGLRDAIRAEGIEAPDALDRSLSRMEGWRHPSLVLGQTCGLPYITRLCDAVALVGTPDYGLEGCPPGHYHSTLVVRVDEPRELLRQFAGSTLALNGTDSQSGYAAIMHAAAPHAEQGRFFGRALRTGTHGAAMRAVADGLADIAAIDSVTWRMSAAPQVARLRALATTDPTPGLPFIARASAPADRLLHACQAAVGALAPSVRAAFGLRGVLPFQRADYEVIASRLAAAQAAHALPALEACEPAGDPS